MDLGQVEGGGVGCFRTIGSPQLTEVGFQFLVSQH